MTYQAKAKLQDSCKKLAKLHNAGIVDVLKTIKNKVALDMYLNELESILGSRFEYVQRDLNA